uniref:HAUS augmin like complex subunit 6 n=1 Tax=Strix occidentalis caurina TaxID=311401 RepID=A0A8D0F3A0_STROC
MSILVIVMNSEKKLGFFLKICGVIVNFFPRLLIEEINQINYYGKHFNIAFLSLSIKVRSMWTLTMEMLTSLKKEKEVVDSVLDVLEGSVGQCILDGTNVVFSVPQLLASRLESDMLQPCTGSVYEAEKLNFLTVIQLLNEALRTLRDEHRQFELNLHEVVENSIKPFNELLQHLESGDARLFRSFGEWDLYRAITDRDKAVIILLSQDLPFSNILQVAKTVISGSPQSGEGKGMALDDLISSVAFNPFLTRNQIPRTPENLLTEIRSSWRKAIQTEGSSDIELAPTEVMIEAPMDARPIMQKVTDSRFVCTSPDFDPPLSEGESQLSSVELGPQEQMGISHVFESPASETSGMQESERTKAQELKYVVLNRSSVDDPEEQTLQYVEKSMNTPDICSENNSRTNVLPSDHFQGSIMNSMQHWNVSPLLSSTSPEAGQLGILDETLPEELGNFYPNKSANSELDFDVIDSTYLAGGSENKGDIKKSKLDLQSPFNTYEVLKKSASRSEEELHQTGNGGESVSCRSDLSLAPEKREKGELCSPSELFSLDEQFIKTPSPQSHNERKYSLSSLLVSCQHLEEMASMVNEIPPDLIHKLKGKCPCTLATRFCPFCCGV